MNNMKRLRVVVMMLVAVAAMAAAQEFPANCRTTTVLKVRSGPGLEYPQVGRLEEGDVVIVTEVVSSGSMNWCVFQYDDGEMRYAAAQYMEYMYPAREPIAEEQFDSGGGWSFSSFLGTVWTIIKYAFWAFLVLLIFAFKDQLLQIAVFVGALMGIGALVFWLLFGNASLGATVGLVVAILMGVKLVMDGMGVEYSNLFEFIYRIVSLPIFYLNRWQHILSEPWRYIIRRDMFSDGTKDVLRPLLGFIQILLYIAITPLRVLNAMIYNLLIFVPIEIYDLIYEVFQPSCESEGKGDFFMWIVNLPVRIAKYPIAHGFVTLLDGVIWTVVDTFVPAVTMYHGTSLEAGQSIAGSQTRNRYLESTATYYNGTFNTGSGSWGGIGIYFASRRTVARTYACNRMGGANPIMIVCRVSLGSIINYALAPSHVYQNTGQYGNHAVLNRYAEQHDYTTGEWWNSSGGYWEYCMFDWQDHYNYPWRIRPVYLFNFRTGRVQHLKGGLCHWTFRRLTYT